MYNSPWLLKALCGVAVYISTNNTDDHEHVSIPFAIAMVFIHARVLIIYSMSHRPCDKQSTRILLEHVLYTHLIFVTAVYLIRMYNANIPSQSTTLMWYGCLHGIYTCNRAVVDILNNGLVVNSPHMSHDLSRAIDCSIFAIMIICVWQLATRDQYAMHHVIGMLVPELVGSLTTAITRIVY